MLWEGHCFVVSVAPPLRVVGTPRGQLVARAVNGEGATQVNFASLEPEPPVTPPTHAFPLTRFTYGSDRDRIVGLAWGGDDECDGLISGFAGTPAPSFAAKPANTGESALWRPTIGSVLAAGRHMRTTMDSHASANS
jgi:hypothetical protein